MPVRTIVGQKIDLESQMCSLCNSVPETKLHLFLYYPQTQPLWFMSPESLRMSNMTFNSYDDFPKFLLYNHGSGRNQDFVLYDSCVFYQIWKASNVNIFDNIPFELMKISKLIGKPSPSSPLCSSHQRSMI
ncbi:hypothetical protein TorRG33x02_200610 [Trema orientale]|uniref:Uncharacterized protein n=1 Tax=Trema orientale TaxID=63057 RepID=A0A2P5EF38_TREOI|nr:hypothetical protein TorRG33x02_200610 [Trema orientale]